MDLREIHWLMNLLTHMDVGIVVFDLEGDVKLWNSFMENHSGISSSDIREKQSLFDVFPVFKEPWLKNKLNSAMLLDHGAFISWEQVPHLFDFDAYRPITGSSGKMFQNISINALNNASGETDLLSLVVYDVTNIALNKLAVEEANRQLQELSRTDALTGLYNRGFWQGQLKDSFQLFKRYQNNCTLLMFDIDHFKKVNDTYGHQAGDAVIQAVATASVNTVRSCDIVGRYGGEEFGILLPETDLEGGRLLAERLRQSVEALEVSYGDQVIPFTISIGVSQPNEHMKSEKEWLEASDSALYDAKEAGRNCVKLAG